MMRRSLLWLAALPAIFFSAAACSGDDEGAPILADIETPSTNPLSGQLGGDDDSPSPFVGEDPDVIIARLDQATAAQDFCALAEALDSTLPDDSDGEAVVAVFVTMADSTQTAVAFVPDDLAESWQAIVDATTAAAATVEQSGGDVSDPALVAKFRTSSFESALAQVDRYVDRNCD